MGHLRDSETSGENKGGSEGSIEAARDGRDCARLGCRQSTDARYLRQADDNHGTKAEIHKYEDEDTARRRGCEGLP